MADQLLLALAQLNPTVGDLAGNCAKLYEAWRKADQHGADLLVATELGVTGYPLEDFATRPSLLEDVRAAVIALAAKTAEGPALLVGAPWVQAGKLYNAVLLLADGKISAEILKHDLPNYGPFDEKRVYSAGPLPQPMLFRGRKLGVIICEDMWTAEVAAHLKQQGAELLLVLNGSPYETDKQKQRYSLSRDRVHETGLPLVYVNQVGGQDELVFDGASFAIDAAGKLAAQAQSWVEDLILLQWCGVELATPGVALATVPDGEAAIYHALAVGLHDYVRKSGFKKIILGMSGGIDSALVAALAVDALGAANVRLVMMPSPYTSKESLDDAAAVAQKLSCVLENISIAPAIKVFADALAGSFAGAAPDITEENIQSRCRGLILMALSNKHGAMVLATGNKSEMAMGYATLYGDMCGGYAPLKDVYKTEVYKLAHWRNANKPDWALGPSGVVITENILQKAPTAELRPGQTDQDSLPPYNVLDDILYGLVEQDMGVSEIAARGHGVTLVERIWKMLTRAEYKRRQAPPGPKITRRHLSKDRRYPIVNRCA